MGAVKDHFHDDICGSATPSAKDFIDGLIDQNRELRAALVGVISVADRNSPEFRRAHAALAAEGPAWGDMQDAPRNVRVLGMDEHANAYVTWWTSGGWCFFDGGKNGGRWHWEPIQWKPLPSPLNTTREGEAV